MAERRRMPQAHLLVLAGGAVIAAGIALPWFNLFISLFGEPPSDFAISGADSEWSAQIAIALGGVTMVLGILGLTGVIARRRPRFPMGAVMTAAAAGSLGFTVIRFATKPAGVRAAWGLYLALAGGAAAVAGAVLVLRGGSVAGAGAGQSPEGSSFGVAAAEPGAAGWSPTHAAPSQGMQAWAAPDPSGGVLATLDGGLPVQVLETRGAWARILCSNGWGAWVDGRLLVSTAPATGTWAAPVTQEAAPAPVAHAAPVAAQGAWAPTHAAPPGGLQTWPEPNPALPPGPSLDPMLPVQVVEWRGAWARIVCSNGWGAWVDGRLLQPATR